MIISKRRTQLLRKYWVTFAAIVILILPAVPVSAEKVLGEGARSCPDAVVYTSPTPDPTGYGLVDSNIWIKLGRRAPRKLTTYSGEDRWPAISPNGCRVAYVSRQNDIQTMWLVNSDGSGTTQLPVPSNTQRPEWSPDGSQIAFGNDGDGFWEVWVINPDGSNLRKLTSHFGPASEPSWSNDGMKLVYAVDDSFTGNFDLYVVNSDGTGQTLLLSAFGSGFSHHLPAWSPDGTQIAALRWAVNSSGPYSLWLMNADGSGGRTIADNLDSANIGNISWSADGRWVFFNRDGQVWKVRKNGMGLTQVTFEGGVEPSANRGCSR